MKKWSGGTLILFLALVLIFRYGLRAYTPPQNQQHTHGFFNLTSDNSIAVSPTHHHHGSTDTVQTQPGNSISEHRQLQIGLLEGVEDLYATISNIPQHLSAFIILWGAMRELISRSDSLPGTAQGVKEAAIAWSHLLLALQEEENTTSLTGIYKSSKHTREDLSCPFSITTFNTSSSNYYNGNSTINLPCGLVQGSSITVVGIPTGNAGSFIVELLGSSSFPGQTNPDIISCYNVTFKNVNGTGHPVIIQNTWTSQQGWGIEERCPSHGSSYNIKVDDLLTCNQQIDGIIKDDKNRSVVDGFGNLTIAKLGAAASLNFPFIDANPFAATLWVGREGFHMTVNGRHETSFAYRMKLEPWVANELKVVGDLNLLSILATQLPVTEDPDFIVDVEKLKAPPISKKRILLLIGVFSTGNNFNRRMALRRSWMQYKDIRSGTVVVRFIIGFNKNDLVNAHLLKEADKYGDIQLMPFVDYYGLITLKTIAICMLGTKVVPAKYVMKTDDDAFVRVDEVLSVLRAKDIHTGLLYGLISFDSSPIRDSNSKWYISEEEWSHRTYPPWAHGPGYIITRDVAKFIVKGHRERMLKLFKLEDVAVGIWIDQFRRSGQHVNYINDDRFHNAGCESDYIVAHYQGPRLQLCLWDKLVQGNGSAICCE